MKRKLIYFPLAIFALIIVALYWQLERNAQGDLPSSLESALLGKQLPKFQLVPLDEDLPEKSNLNLPFGQPFLINVWATWCPTCHAEHQYLNRLSRDGIMIVGLNYKDSRQLALSWLNRLGNPYAVNLFDGDGMIGLDLGVYGAPETFLIDANGIVRYRHAGAIDNTLWQQEIAPLWQKYSLRKE